jgi:hypothetical protein
MRVFLLAAALAAGLCVPAVALALPNQVAQEGLVYDDNGRAFEGPHDIRVRLYAAPAGGVAFFDEVHPNVEFFAGYYFIDIGSIQPLNVVDINRPTVYLGLSIDQGADLVPRTALRKVPASFVADIALNVTGNITPNTVSAGGRVVINDLGRWVGDPTGLAGPAGAQGVQGPAGPQGAQGAQGPAGGGGADADPVAVVPLVVAALAADPAALHYVRDDQADTKAGALNMQGGDLTMTGGDVVMQGGSISFPPAQNRLALDLQNNDLRAANLISINDPGPDGAISWTGTDAKVFVSPLDGSNADGFLRVINSGGISLEGAVQMSADLTMAPGANISLNDRAITGVGDPGISFADPGPDGALSWGGSQASILVSPLDGSNADGYLRLINDGGISLESPVRASSDLWVMGRLGVGTIDPASRVEFRDDRARDTGITVRNWQPNARTRPFVQFMGRTPAAQATTGMIRLLSGADAGGNDARNEAGLEFLVSSGAAGAMRSAMTVQHDGDVGVGTAAPLGRLHVNGANSNTNPVVIQSNSPGLYFFDSETLNGSVRHDSFAVEVDDDKFFIGSKAKANSTTPGVGSRSFTVQSNGNVGIGTRSPAQKLEVAGNLRMDFKSAARPVIELFQNNVHRWDIGANSNGALHFMQSASGWANSELVLAANGNVGVGTIAPAQKLDVAGNTYVSGRVGIGHAGNWHQNLSVKRGLALQGDGNDSTSYLQMFLDGSNNTVFQLFGAQGWVNRMLINNDNGHVGIGTDAPLGRLHVAGADSRSTPVVIQSTSPGLYLFDNETSNGALRYDSFAIEVDGNNFYVGAKAKATSATPGSGDRSFRIKSDGDVRTTGGLDVGKVLTIRAPSSVRHAGVFSFVHPAGGYARGQEWAQRYYHIRTPDTNGNGDMFRYDIRGYSYGIGRPLSFTFVGYLYTTLIHTFAENNTSNGIRCTTYIGSDRHLYLKFGPVRQYYNSFTLDYQSGSTGERLDHGHAAYSITLTAGDVKL